MKTETKALTHRVAIVLCEHFTKREKKTRSQHNLGLEWLIHSDEQHNVNDGGLARSLMEYANYECSFANSLVNCLTKNLHIIRVCVCARMCMCAACCRETKWNSIKRNREWNERPISIRFVECHLNVDGYAVAIHRVKFLEEKREQAWKKQ